MPHSQQVQTRLSGRQCLERPQRAGEGIEHRARSQGAAGGRDPRVPPSAHLEVCPLGGSGARRRGGRSQRAVPGFQQHALQKQPAPGLQVGLVQPHGQVAEGEVSVGRVCQLFHHRALQAELLAVHVRELAGDLVCNERRPPRTAAFAGGGFFGPAALLMGS